MEAFQIRASLNSLAKILFAFFVLACVAHLLSAHAPEEENIPMLSEQAKTLIYLPEKIMGDSHLSWIKLLGEPKQHSQEALENLYGKDSFPLSLHSLKWAGIEMEVQEVKGYRDFILELKIDSPVKPFKLPVRWGMSPLEVKEIIGPPQYDFDDTMVRHYLHRSPKDPESVWGYGNLSGTYAAGILLIFDNQHLVSLVWQYGMD